MKLTPEQEALQAAAIRAVGGDPWYTTEDLAHIGSGGLRLLGQDATFIERARPSTILALLAQLEAAQAGVSKVTSTPSSCPNAAHMGEHACRNRHQCFEPCGELGHSAEHAKPAPKEIQDAVNLAVGKGAPVDERAKPTRQIVAGLQGMANHVRAVPQYRNLLGDMDIVDKAIAALQQPGQAVPDKFAGINQHHVADAFWESWKQNGVPHKHGYYESTWIALRAAIRAAAELGKAMP